MTAPATLTEQIQSDSFRSKAMEQLQVRVQNDERFEAFWKAVSQYVESAFREGYRQGYSNGGSDAVAFEWGSGSRADASQKREQDEAWEYSDAKKELNP